MKKYVLAGVLAVLVTSSAGAGVWVWRQRQDPLEHAHVLAASGNLRAAQLILRSAVLKDPTNDEAHFRLGSADLELGDPFAAEKELRDAAKHGKDATAVSPLLAQAVLAQGKFQDVLAEFRSDGLPPAVAADIEVSRGLAQLGLKQVDAAAATIAAAMRLDPNGVAALLGAERVALARGDAAGAEARLDQALQIDAHSVEALKRKAALLETEGHHAAALDAYDKAIAIAPGMTELRIGRASVLLTTRDNAKAAQDIDLVLKANPKERLALYLQAILFIRDRQWAKADVNLQQLTVVLPSLPRGEYFVALVKSNLNQLEQASDAATRYGARAPGDLDGIKLLASIDLAAHRPGHAVDVLERAVVAHPTDIASLRLLGAAQAAAGQVDRAVQSLEQAGALAPADPTIARELGLVRLQAGDATDAVRDLQHSLEMAPASPASTTTAATLVMAALRVGDLTQATAALETARQQKAEPVLISSLTGVVKAAQFDLDGARAAFEDALKAQPDNSSVRLNLAHMLSVQGKSAQAIELIKEGLTKQPADLALLGSLVPMLLAQQEKGRAIAVVEAAHLAAPEKTGLTIALAELYVRTGAPSKALDLLDHVSGPPDRVLAVRAMALQALNKPNDAASAYRQILQNTPSDVQARLQLVALQMAANDASAAKATLQEGLAAVPGSLPLLETWVSVTAHVDGIEAGLALAARLEQDPANLPASRLLVGDLDMSAGRFAAAAAAFAVALQKAPSAVLVQRAAVAWNAAGAHDKALSVVRDWVAQHPEDFSMTVSLAGQQLEDGDLVAAEANLNKVLVAQPNDALALNNLAWLYQQRGDPRARALAQKAYLISPRPQVADTLGWILANSGEASSGVLLLRQAAAQMPGNPAVQFHLAAALNNSGHAGEALTVMRALPAGGFPEKSKADKLLLQLAPN